MSDRGHEEEQLSEDHLLALLDRTGVRREGHFLLTSGRHSPFFLLFSQLFQNPEEGSSVARALAAGIRKQGWEAETVCGPAMGGVLLSYELARALNCRSIYTEKVDTGMALRRGFQVRPGERIILVEDAVTTGGSLRKSMDALAAEDVHVVGIAAVVDRSGGKVDFGVPFFSLVTLEVPSYDPSDCPLCHEGLPLTAPKTSN